MTVGLLCWSTSGGCGGGVCVRAHTCVCPGNVGGKSPPQGVDLSRGAGTQGQEWDAWFIGRTLGPNQTSFGGWSREASCL